MAIAQQPGDVEEWPEERIQQRLQEIEQRLDRAERDIDLIDGGL